MRVLLQLGISLLFLASCKKQQQLNLHVKVIEKNAPVEGIEVFVAGKKVGSTNKEGELRAQVSPGSQDKMRLWVSDPHLDALRYSDFQDVETDRPFFEDEVGVVFELKSFSTAPQNVAQEEEESVALTPYPIAEATLQDEIVPTPNAVNTAFNSNLAVEMNGAELALAEPTVQPTPVPDNPQVAVATPVASPTSASQKVETTVQAALPSADSITIEVFSEGKPVSGAQVFVGRHGPRTFSFLGESKNDGTLLTQLTRSLRGESLLVRHDCCAPLLRPFGAAKEAKTMRVDLTPGFGQDLIAMQYTYGIGRGLENVQLFGKTGQIDNSNPVGYLLAPAKVVQASYKVTGKEIIGGEKEVTSELVTKTPSRPKIVYLATARAPKPTIGLLELRTEENSFASEDAAWRRAKRDFISRFLQAQSFRPVIAAEVQRLASAISLKAEDLADHGWEFTPLKEQYDAIFVMDFRKAEPVARVVDRTGNIVSTLSLKMDPGAPPEQLGSRLYRDFVTEFPFEGNVTSRSGNDVVINFGNNSKRELKQDQWFVFYGARDALIEAPTQPIALGKIKQINETTTTVEIVSDRNEIPVLPGALAARMSQEKARSEFEKNKLASSR